MEREDFEREVVGDGVERLLDGFCDAVVILVGVLVSILVGISVSILVFILVSILMSILVSILIIGSCEGI